MINSHFNKSRLIGLLTLFFLSGVAATAQTDSGKKALLEPAGPAAQNTSNAMPEKPKANGNLPSEVIGVYSCREKEEKREIASIGDLIVVRISNGDAFKKRSLCQDNTGADLPAGTCRKQDVKLFINGRRISGIKPEDGAPQLDAQTGDGLFQFRLDRNSDNDEIWADILGAPPLFKKESFIVPVSISIGLENDYALPPAATNADAFHIERIHKGWFWFCFAGILVYIGVLVYLIKNKGLLQDRIIDLRDTEIQNPNHANGLFAAPPARAPYSLGRFQMAFWFTLVIVSYLFIWLITDAYDILTASVLALIGISAGTSLSAAIIDNSKHASLITETRELQLKQSTATTPIESAQLLDKIKGNIKQLESRGSKGFLHDLLQDANGISFHRMQMLVWTFILGLLFVYTVWKRLSMPDFNAALLALQGITAGTYLGFKFPEKHN